MSCYIAPPLSSKKILKAPGRSLERMRYLKISTSISFIKTPIHHLRNFLKKYPNPQQTSLLALEMFIMSIFNF